MTLGTFRIFKGFAMYRFMEKYRNVMQIGVKIGVKKYGYVSGNIVF